MDKNTKLKEKEYLERTCENIDQMQVFCSQKIESNTKDIASFKKFFADNYYDIRHGNKDEFVGEDEFANINISIENLELQNESLKNTKKRLKKQRKSPYFGRFDFQTAEDASPVPYYIGLGLVQDKDKNNLVYDWRADISSLYYDDQFGKTSYTCPDGEIEGNLSLKRQYKIENSSLKYFIDSNLVIDDEILMEQLSQNATSKMHDIVSTIQKEQNTLIRSDDFENVIVQGVAGSGKTSIAMHRVSYLLYKYRKQLKSEDILILSPSEMFADYIDEVLPALGEEKTYSTTFSTMAKRLLGEKFEQREDLLERVIDSQKQKDFENIAIKSSFEFLEDLKNFLNNHLCNLFLPKTLSFGDIVITKEELYDIFFNKLKTLAVGKRIEVLAEHIADHFRVSENAHEELIKRAKKILYNKFITTDLLKIYNIFLASVDLPEVSKIGAYDVAPVLLIKENLFSLKDNFNAKYVIVDEMQDYTPCHFYLFEKIWRCPKLYLGDIYQSIDRTLSPEYLISLAKLVRAKIKYLNKSYRSTLQISLFAQRILGKHIANNVNRHGEAVEFIKCKSQAKAIEKILAMRMKKHSLKKQKVAIICKTQKSIADLQSQNETLKKFKQLDPNKNMSKAKFIITTPAKAKGVEFDCVIIPFANEETYCNELDKNLLYVSATRALHKLYFICDKTPSKFLTKNKKIIK
ncbi:MAG: AAA family ATPase [Clostridia bacterium]|nr:AAA family ATPase [Clostridia bacterium]